ncbi:carboxymuconolactone decarboxylase family protein [Roseovarius spongiae]|uniref:Carboxymuconolactone decarboxylase family protein n=1 Tax=Roseovarius spongiae TaxID=2320272 RepID=A0A3A8B3B1_9RHOB|nr:carboxymuconolactone decarboxylase family protein [Roseovarius spongiae]RKF15012.1 carboxymuconolactone decarboxylase family protein [Roseovarius spongiae]
MSDPANPFEAMMRQAQEMAKAFPAMDAFTPKAFEQMMGTMPRDVMDFWFGDAVNKGGLDARTRMLLTVAGLTMQGAQNDIAFRQAVRHAVEAGATKQHIVETIGQMSMFAGLPAMTRALDLAQQVLDKKDEEGKDT